MTIRQLKILITNLPDDATIRLGSDDAYRLDYLNEISYDNDTASCEMYFSTSHDTLTEVSPI